MIRVALDAMGGDTAPAAEVGGALRALADLPGDFQVQLVGRPDAIEAALAKHPGVDRSRLQVVAASEVVTMTDKPLEAVRRKRDSSIVVGLGLQKAAQSDAFVSAGNTGATLAASTVILGLHDGVRRATVGTLFPTGDRPVLVLDAGANVDSSAEELVGFARLGTVYVRDILGRSEPRVGLLNVGEEDEKGNALSREAHQMLKGLPGIAYVGNVEGRDIIAGHSKLGLLDIVVCDGFVGNILLKFYESVAQLIIRLVRDKAPELLRRDDVRDVLRVLDYAEYGGAPLLGVRGVSIICHGSSSPDAIKNAIRVAVQAVAANLSGHIGAEFAGRAGAAAS